MEPLILFCVRKTPLSDWVGDLLGGTSYKPSHPLHPFANLMGIDILTVFDLLVYECE